jgi:hypothetical protein
MREGRVRSRLVTAFWPTQQKKREIAEGMLGESSNILRGLDVDELSALLS